MAYHLNGKFIHFAGLYLAHQAGRRRCFVFFGDRRLERWLGGRVIRGLRNNWEHHDRMLADDRAVAGGVGGQLVRSIALNRTGGHLPRSFRLKQNGASFAKRFAVEGDRAPHDGGFHIRRPAAPRREGEAKHYGDERDDSVAHKVGE